MLDESTASRPKPFARRYEQNAVYRWTPQHDAILWTDPAAQLIE